MGCYPVSGTVSDVRFLLFLYKMPLSSVYLLEDTLLSVKEEIPCFLPMETHYPMEPGWLIERLKKKKKVEEEWSSLRIAFIV